MTTNPAYEDSSDHIVETKEWPIFQRWTDSSGDNLFIRRRDESSHYFQLGDEYHLPASDGIYMYGGTISYNISDAADLIRRIAEVAGLEVDIRTKEAQNEARTEG